MKRETENAEALNELSDFHEVHTNRDRNILLSDVPNSEIPKKQHL